MFDTNILKSCFQKNAITTGVLVASYFAYDYLSFYHYRVCKKSVLHSLLFRRSGVCETTALLMKTIEVTFEKGVGAIVSRLCEFIAA
jgi:hypothetical protein